MKRSLIFLLAAGPLFVFGQRPDLPGVLKTFRSPGPGPVLVFPGSPVRLLAEPPVHISFVAGFTVREMQPDRMPCLAQLRMPERMPVSRSGNADPLPNAVPRTRR